MEVWPECRASLDLFVALQTQWNVAVGLGGGQRIGLRYEAVYPLLDQITDGDRQQWRELLDDMLLMERAVLEIPTKSL